MNKLSPFATGVAFAFSSAALFAIRPVIVKLVYAQGVDSLSLIFYRMLFSAPLYLILLIYLLRDPERRSRLNPKLLFQIGCVGLMGYYVASYLDLLGLQHVTAQLGRMILYSYPTFVVILGAMFFSERITLRTVISLLLTYIGITVIFGHDLSSFGEGVALGAFFILLCALVFAFYLLISKSLIDKVGSNVFTCLALLSASFGVMLHFLIAQLFIAQQNTSGVEVGSRGFWLILFISIFCTVIPSFCTSAALARIGADKTSIIATIGPIFTSVFAVQLLSEEFTIYHMIGIVLVICGVANLRSKQPSAR